MTQDRCLDNVYCLWYPTGGFGHWLSACISITARDFCQVDQREIVFSPQGDSHSVPLMAPKYLHNANDYEFDFQTDKKYVVLIDNGINDESRQFQRFFPGASIIKVTYDDLTWPIVAATMMVKTQGPMDQTLCPDQTGWQDCSDWARREKYFLYLRDHDLRRAWRASTGCHNLRLDQLLDSADLRDSLGAAGINLGNFQDLWSQWRKANALYLDPVEQASAVIQHLREGQVYDLGTIQDLWGQAVVNYYIWLHFGIEVPANDFADWFKNWDDLCDLLQR